MIDIHVLSVFVGAIAIMIAMEVFNEVYKYYETIMDDLLFEARLESNDPANGYSVDTEWLSKVLKDVQVGMRDY